MGSASLLSDIIVGTPANLTYGNIFVIEGWKVAWYLATTLFVLLILWTGIILVYKHMTGQSSPGWRALLPRLILGLLAAYLSLWWCGLFCELADGASRTVARELNVSPGDMVGSVAWELVLYGVGYISGRGATSEASKKFLSGKTTSVVSKLGSAAPVGKFLATKIPSLGIMIFGALTILFFIFIAFAILVLGQLIVRIVLIGVLIALAPLAMLAFCVPQTEQYAKTWITLFAGNLLQQVLQLIAISIAIGFMTDFGRVADGGAIAFLWQTVMGIMGMFVAWKLPSLMGSVVGSFSEGWLSTVFMATNFWKNIGGAVTGMRGAITGNVGDSSSALLSQEVGRLGLAVSALAAGRGANVASLNPRYTSREFQE